MVWEVWWALVLGFAISAMVQAWAPRERIQRALGGSGPRPLTLATALGAASSSCSYAAVAIARGLLVKGASAVSALAFQFASTNLVFELGIVLWLLLGWQFALGELVGGLVLVALTALLSRTFISPGSERRAREHAREVQPTHQHEAAGGRGGLRRLRSASAWSDVAHNFRNDWSMLWKEITLGFVLAGFIGQLHNGFFSALFVTHAPAGVKLLENAVVGPIVAALSFVCSVGNVPLAAVLWSGGIGFGGVVAFIFADLLVLPIVWIYRKYYGLGFALRVVGLMLVTIVLAALAVDTIFSTAGLIPHARPSRAEIFAPVRVDYEMFANIGAFAVFAGLFVLTVRRGARDPVCGMRVDRHSALTREFAGRRYWFCSTACMDAFEQSPRDRLGMRRFVAARARAAEARAPD